MNFMTESLSHWAYPELIAHRGAGKQAPENTLAAMRLGAKHGFKMVEFDVKLSQDGAAILLHDDTLDRTSNATGLASEYSLAELLNFDFGSWLKAEYVAEPIATLNTVAAFTLSQGIHSNIEIKPETGYEAETGAKIARLARELWQDATLPPLLSSFSEVALAAAQLSAPELPRALLIEGEVPQDIFDRLQRWDCVALNLDDKFTTQALIQQAKERGYAVCVWTVNDPQRARELLQWGCKGIFTDAIDTIAPNQPF